MIDLLVEESAETVESSLSVNGARVWLTFASTGTEDLFPDRSRCTWPPQSKIPSHQHLPGMTFATQMPLARRRYSVSYSKKAHNLEPPYGIEP